MAMTDREKLRSIVTDDPQSWDIAWKQNLTPWDHFGDVQPPLREVVESNEVAFPTSGRALVPGCGRGYDPIFLALALGLDVEGLDISETALEAANKLLSEAPGFSRGSVTFKKADFFELTNNLYDVVYDYTFFVAIPPALRPAWGSQMRALVKPGGYLITLIYPIVPEPYLDGPPFYVQPEHHVEVLGEGWEKIVDRVPTSSIESHVGKERIVVWKRV
ncbi:S-adenosyl-L-methionine-dependent methyltransferase [Mycena floridula]|nr:S-adenosyl-L-methionine-dependent methyltransferase [Mycena floridula]